MNAKCQYREYFAQCKSYVKFTAIFKDVGIPQSAFSRFMQGYDWFLSVESLQKIEDRLKEIAAKIV